MNFWSYKTEWHLIRAVFLFTVFCLGVGFAVSRTSYVKTRHPVSFYHKEITSLPEDFPEIPLQAERFYQDINSANRLEKLIDNNPATAVSPNYKALVKPSAIWYEFPAGMQVRIKKLKLFDGEGVFKDKPVKIFIISPTSWKRKLVAEFGGDKYNQWVEFVLADLIPARYLVIEAQEMLPAELKLFGSYQKVRSPKVKKERVKYRFRNYLGVNGFEWNLLADPHTRDVDKIYEPKLSLIKPFGGFRHYFDWERMEPESGKYTFNPSRSGGWNYDLMYQRLKDEGVETLICFKTIPDFIKNTYPEAKRDRENIPAPFGADLSDPASYIQQARAAFQFVARYGYNQSVDSALIKVDSSPLWNANGPKNEIKIGLSLVKYIECDNERDKWWKGRTAYQLGREYAANLSAFYDGHQGKLGKGVGVKPADPSCKVVIGGIANTYPDYIRAIIDWCKEFRNGDLCFDVINYHQYPNANGSMQYGEKSTGIAPELSEMNAAADRFLKTSAEYGKHKEVWLTETGYDVHPESNQRAPAIGSKSALDVQADWIIRTALLLSRKGIAKCFFYELFDDNTSSETFSTSGLADEHSLKPRPALDYLTQAGKLLGDFHYEKTICSKPIVDRYRFNKRSIYVLVSPTQSGAVINFELTLPKGTKRVKQYELRAGTADMQERVLPVFDQKIKLKVGETPVFVEPLN